MGQKLNPSAVANSFRDEIRSQVEAIGHPLKLVGFLTSDFTPSMTYADYTRRGCESVGIGFEARTVSKHELEHAILMSNEDPSVHGILVYYPVFGVEQDNYLKDQVDPKKDVEGLHTYWLRKLYHNERTDDEGNKAILPCTPLAILKLIDAIGEMKPSAPPLANREVVIFNRSEVVGRPLASMMANDGARVLSFDINGLIEFTKDGPREADIARTEALAAADIVVTGVPSREFPLIRAEEIRDNAVCINFSTIKNYTREAAEKARIFVPRVGPMTVTIALRNTLRLFHSYHSG